MKLPLQACPPLALITLQGLHRQPPLLAKPLVLPPGALNVLALLSHSPDRGNSSRIAFVAVPASLRVNLDTGVCETAAALLGVADEAGLAHLRAVALDFAVMHFGPVAKTAAWAGLPRSCADAVAMEVSCGGHVLCDAGCLG